MPHRSRSCSRSSSSSPRSRLAGVALALLGMALMAWRGAEAATLAPYDLNKDWISGIMAKGVNGCVVAPPSSSRPLPIVATPAPNTTTVAQIIAQGWRIAPKVYMHPMEWSHLTDPAKWLQKTPIYDPVDLTKLNLSSLSNYTTDWQLLVFNVLGARFFASGLWDGFGGNASNTMSTAELKRRTYGDPADSRNYSTAIVWYTAMDAHDAKDKVAPATYARGQAVIFKFHYFYPFNGCSNQLLALAIGGKYQGNEYYMCPPGVHEGDLEHMSMLVSVARWNESDPFSSIMRVQYAAHSWNSQYDCYLGECPWELDDQGIRRLVAYSGLYSHAMYPTASPLQLYMKVSAAFLLNVDGVYIGDRTAKRVGWSNGTQWGGMVFHPTANNTKFLPFLENMTQAQINGEFAWAAYPGSFGGYIVTSESIAVPCLFNNFSTEGPCPAGNPATSYLNFALSIKQTIVSLGNMVWRNYIKAPFTVDPILGPLYRTYTYVWENSNSPPLYDNPKENITCPFSGDPSETKSSTNYSSPDVVTFLLSVAAILIGGGVLFTLALFFPLMSPESETKYLMRLIHQAKKAAQQGADAAKAEHDSPPGTSATLTTTAALSGASASAATATKGDVAVVNPLAAPMLPRGMDEARRGGAEGDGDGNASSSGGESALDEAEERDAEARPWWKCCQLQCGRRRSDAGDGAPVGPAAPCWKCWLWRCWRRQPTDSQWEPNTLNFGGHLAWLLLALGLSIGGITLAAVGIDGVVEATEQLVDIALWDVIRQALITVLVIFGVLHVLVIISLIFFRNNLWVRLCMIKLYNPLSRWRGATRMGWIFTGVNSGLHVIALNTTVLLFSFGVFLTVAQIIVQVACNTALELLFSNLDNASYVCLDLTQFGIDVKFCGSDLTRVCSLWQGLAAPYIAYGSLLLILAHLLVLSLCVQQFVTLRNVLTAMNPRLRPLLDVQWDEERYEEKEQKRRASQIATAAPAMGEP